MQHTANHSEKHNINNRFIAFFTEFAGERFFENTLKITDKVIDNISLVVFWIAYSVEFPSPMNMFRVWKLALFREIKAMKNDSLSEWIFSINAA